MTSKAVLLAVKGGQYVVEGVDAVFKFKVGAITWLTEAAKNNVVTEAVSKAGGTMVKNVAELPTLINGKKVGQIIGEVVQQGENLAGFYDELVKLGKPLDDFGVKAHTQLAKLLSRDLGYYPGEKATRACVMLCNKLEDGVRYEDFIKGFTKADGTVAKDQLKTSLDAYFDATRNLPDGECPALPVKGIDQIHPTLYHYAPEDTLLQFSDEVGNGVFELFEFDGRYWTPEQMPNGLIPDGPFAGRFYAQDRLQLPKKRLADGTWVEQPTKGRFECRIQTSEIADDCSVPQGFSHSQDGVGYIAKDRLEPVTVENSSRGGGGTTQFSQKLVNGKKVHVAVFDKLTGEQMMTKNDIRRAVGLPEE